MWEGSALPKRDRSLITAAALVALYRTNELPHLIVKLWPGKSETQKYKLAHRIANDMMGVLGYGEESVSVAFQEISSDEWAEKVYKTDMENPRGKLYKKPGYRM